MKLQTINPATQLKIKSYEYNDVEQAQNQISLFSEQQINWARQTLQQRIDIVKKIAAELRSQKDSLALKITTEMGKPIIQSLAEISKCADALDTLSDLSLQHFKTRELSAHYSKLSLVAQPYGLVLSIQPWNFPFWQVLRMAACAWLGGNLVVLKHSDIVAGCAEMIEKICHINNFRLLLNLRLTHADTQEIIKSPLISLVTLTGSSRAGRQVGAIAGASLKKQIFELGGADAYIVLPDADLELAVKNCVKSRLINSGQSCISAKRFFVHKSLFHEFKKKFLELMKAAVVGDPLESATEVGPLAHENFVISLNQQIEKALSEGAKFELAQDIFSKSGNYVRLGLLDFSDNLLKFRDEELFGPVACVYSYEKIEDVITAVNAGPYALAGAVFSRDVSAAKNISEQLQVATVVINTFVQTDARVPFGGMKDSGFGREMGELGLNEFVIWKVIGEN